MVEAAPARPREQTPDPVPFALPDVGDEEAEAVASTIRSGWVTSGPAMRAFEAEFRDFLGGDPHAVAVNSATAGLHLVLEALGVGPGDEVIVPDWTFTATAEVVRYLGATPVLVDVDPATLNIDIDRVAAALTVHTKAVMPVHFAGLPVDMKALHEVVAGHSVHVVEDAAHALPAGDATGTVGNCQYSDAAVFSFYATKTLTTGEGGMITTTDADLAGRARVMRLHGIDRDAFNRYNSHEAGWAYDVVAPGFKYNMPDTAAAMGRVQLRRAHRMRERRQAIAEHYSAQFSGLPVQLPQHGADGATHAWHLYVIRLHDDARVDREEFIAGMTARRIGTSVHFIPLHEHTYWRPYIPNPVQQVPVSCSESQRAVSLPISSRLTDDQVERVVGAVRALLR